MTDLINTDSRTDPLDRQADCAYPAMLLYAMQPCETCGAERFGIWNFDEECVDGVHHTCMCPGWVSFMPADHIILMRYGDKIVEQYPDDSISTKVLDG